MIKGQALILSSIFNYNLVFFHQLETLECHYMVIYKGFLTLKLYYNIMLDENNFSFSSV